MLALAICCWSDDPGCDNGDWDSAIDISIAASCEDGHELICIRATRGHTPPSSQSSWTLLGQAIICMLRAHSKTSWRLHTEKQLLLSFPWHLPSPDHAFTGFPFKTDKTPASYAHPHNEKISVLREPQLSYSRFHANTLCFALPADFPKASMPNSSTIQSSKFETQTSATQDNIKNLVIRYLFTLVHFCLEKYITEDRVSPTTKLVQLHV